MIATHKDDEPEKRPLPEGWVWKTVDEISESIRYGYTESANEKPVGPRFLRITDIQDGRVDWDTVPYCPCSAEDHQKYKLLPGDIVFARTGATTGKSFLIKQCPDTIFASYLIRLRLKSVANTKFFSYFLQTPDYWSQITFVKKGSAQPGVNATLLATLKLPLPPLTEQERIVARLEELLSDLEAGVAALGRVRAGVKRYKASVLKAAVEGRLFGNKPEGLPDGWEWKTLSEVVGKDGIFVDGDWVESKDQDPNGDVRLIQLADIGDGYYRNRSNRFLTYKKALELGCTFLQEGDLLVARMPDPLGRACIFPGDIKTSVTVVDVCVIRTGADGANHQWLMYTINSPNFRAEVEVLQSGSTRKRISRKNLAKILLPLPPIMEQKRIVAEVERRLESARAVESAVEVGLKRARRLRQAVLRSAFEGRLI